MPVMLKICNLLCGRGVKISSIYYCINFYRSRLCCHYEEFLGKRVLLVSKKNSDIFVERGVYPDFNFLRRAALFDIILEFNLNIAF